MCRRPAKDDMLKVIANMTMKLTSIKSVSVGTDINPPYKYTVINTYKCNFKLHSWGKKDREYL